MSFFKSFTQSAPATKQCKCCARQVSEDTYAPDFEMCQGCLLIAQSFLQSSFNPGLARFEKEANAATDPEAKIGYLAMMLELLYEYKIKYEDKDIRFMKEDISISIDAIIDGISRARLSS